MIDLANPETDIEKLYYDFKEYHLTHYKPRFRDALDFYATDFLEWQVLLGVTPNFCSRDIDDTAKSLFLVWERIGFIKRVSQDIYVYRLLK